MKKFKKLCFWHNLGLGLLQVLILVGVYFETGILTATFFILLMLAFAGVLQRLRKLTDEYESARFMASMQHAQTQVLIVYLRVINKRLDKAGLSKSKGPENGREKETS